MLKHSDGQGEIGSHTVLIQTQIQNHSAEPLGSVINVNKFKFLTLVVLF